MFQQQEDSIVTCQTPLECAYGVYQRITPHTPALTSPCTAAATNGSYSKEGHLGSTAEARVGL